MKLLHKDISNILHMKVLLSIWNCFYNLLHVIFSLDSMLKNLLK